MVWFIHWPGSCVASLGGIILFLLCFCGVTFCVHCCLFLNVLVLCYKLKVRNAQTSLMEKHKTVSGFLLVWKNIELEAAMYKSFYLYVFILEHFNFFPSENI
jgi:hypothetical protein